MKHIISSLNIQIPFGRTVIALDATWLVVLPAATWAIGTLYVPILGPFLNSVETWAVALGITLLSLISLFGHIAGHEVATRASSSDVPPRLLGYPFGDAAQIWLAASSAWREVLVATAGPLVNLLLAGLAYLLWEAQLSPSLNLSMIFLFLFNVVIAAINLTPAYPFDGGRLLRAIGWGLFERPVQVTRLGVKLGYLISAVLTGWGIFLITQQARFSWQTGSATLVVVGLMLLGLGRQPAWTWDRSISASKVVLPGLLIRAPVAGLLLASMLSISFSLVPTNYGLMAPGFAEPVAPMIYVPPEHRHSSTGSFVLTTVLWQMPIPAGLWVYGQLSPVVEIVRPRRVVPPNTTLPELAQQQYEMMTESELKAMVVGLRLADYEVTVKGEGVRVVSILSDSPAESVLQPGDVIVSLNGQPLRTRAELTDRLSRQEPEVPIYLQIERDSWPLEVAVPLMPPVEQDQPPRLGIIAEPAGFEAKLPFRVEIVPRKIFGGPSAGLMFTLTVYNLVTPEDLTGGWKVDGTGTIDLDGTIGMIGGVQQKVASAERVGAEYFLSPPENYAEARAVARRIKVVQVATVEQAIQFLQSLPPREYQASES